jgi:dephospho-CoA kinase
MTVILVTGMSGTGKSTALAELARRGYQVVDTDFGEWIDRSGVEPLWRSDRIDALITGHRRSGEPLFIAGTVLNQEEFYPRFDEIVLLSVPLPVMLERVLDRANPFGRTAAERARIVADTVEIEPLLRSSATVEIDTRKAVGAVADQLAALAGPPVPRAG